MLRNSYTVTVKLLCTRTFSVLVSPSCNVATLKQRIFEREHIPVQQQTLMIAGKQLAPDTTLLSAYNLKPGDTVYVVTGKPAPITLEHKMAGKAVEQQTTASQALTSTQKQNVKDDALIVSNANAPNTDISKMRATTIKAFCNVSLAFAAVDTKDDEKTATHWPKKSQVYCVYTREAACGNVTGIVTFGMSNPYQTVLHYPIGSSIEIVVEMLTKYMPFRGAITSDSVSTSWLFAVCHEVAHQCHKLGLQVRQILEGHSVASMEIAGISAPPEFLDPVSGSCCVLVGHLNDPGIPRGFNVTVLHGNQWILQSILFIPVRILTFAQCQMIRKGGAAARKQLAQSFTDDGTFSVSHIPSVASTPASTASVK